MTYQKFIYRIALFFVSFFICSNTVNAQALKTTINRNEILIGEQIDFEISINLANSSYKIDIGIPDSIPHFEIIDQNKYDTVDENGMYTLRQHIQLTSFDSGDWQIPSFPVSISFPNKATQNFLSDSFLVKVGYSPADSTGQLRDIKPVMEVFVIDRKWMYIAAACLLILIIAFIIYRYFKKRKKKTVLLFKTTLSPYDEAIKALNKLQQQPVSDTDALKLFYGSLSDIFKRYYSRKSNRNLMSETTGELLIMLQNHTKSPETLSAAAQALRCADAVKFAKYIPPDAENKQSVLQVKEIIDQLEKKSTF